MPYGIIDDEIYDSSVAEHWEALVTLEQLVVLCDKDGVIDKTPEAISRRTNIPQDIIDKGLEILEAPDPKSRNPNKNGIRIELLDPEHRDWGWRIVNYAYWRNRWRKRDQRGASTERVRRHRHRQQGTLFDEEVGENIGCKPDKYGEPSYRYPKAVAYPEGMRLTRRLLEYGMEKGLTERRVKLCFEAFETYWRDENPKKRSVDWGARFQRWVLNEAARLPANRKQEDEDRPQPPMVD